MIFDDNIYTWKETDIRYQLEAILKSDTFHSSKVLSEFLKFVVTEMLEGRDNEIKEYTVAVKGLGRGKDFNPQSLALVRIYAGRLRKLLDLYYSKERHADRIRITIPKGSYTPIFKNINKNL